MVRHALAMIFAVRSRQRRREFEPDDLPFHYRSGIHEISVRKDGNGHKPANRWGTLALPGWSRRRPAAWIPPVHLAIRAYDCRRRTIHGFVPHASVDVRNLRAGAFYPDVVLFPFPLGGERFRRRILLCPLVVRAPGCEIQDEEFGKVVDPIRACRFESAKDHRVDGCQVCTSGDPDGALAQIARGGSSPAGTTGQNINRVCGRASTPAGPNDTSTLSSGNGVGGTVQSAGMRSSRSDSCRMSAPAIASARYSRRSCTRWHSSARSCWRIRQLATTGRPSG